MLEGGEERGGNGREKRGKERRGGKGKGESKGREGDHVRKSVRRTEWWNICT